MLLIFLPWILTFIVGLIFQVLGYTKNLWILTAVSGILYFVSVFMAAREIKYTFYFLTLLTLFASIQERKNFSK